MKVHEFAKEKGITSKDALTVLRGKGVEVKSHMSNLTDEALAVLAKAYGTVDVAEVEKKKEEKKKTSTKAKKTDKETGKKASHKKALSDEEESDALIAQRGKKEKKEKAPKFKEAEERAYHEAKKAKKKVPKQKIEEKKEFKPSKEPSKRPEAIKIKIPISVSGLATNLMVKTSDLIKRLIGFGIFATVNQLLDEETVMKIGETYGVLIEKLPNEEEQLIQEHETEDTEQELELRPPVVTMMGHVDHGKTSLLDAIRSSNVALREAGKITQHIGAYEVILKDRGRVTFLDTPGHAAFTEMRARGANVTDLVIIVVAADDGIMPQTIEAIDHAAAAEGTKIVVAINKCDLPGANVDKVKGQFQQHGFTPEDWGGETIMLPVSAKTGEGIDDLLEMLLLEAELLELKANPNRRAQGTVIEGKLSKSLGSVATVLVQNGTLHVGDIVVCGQYYGKVRAMHNDRGKNTKEAGPSVPVEILGLNGVPEAGEKFYCVEDEKQARTISEKRRLQIKERDAVGNIKHLSLEGLYEMMKETGVKELKIIIKADVQGSAEVLKQSLEKLSTEKIKLRVIHTGVGGINESDVVLAAASDAVIIGFHVKADSKAQSVIEREKVDVRYYKIIYEVTNDVKNAMQGLLEPTIREVVLGNAEVKHIFKASKIGNIAGCLVQKGKLVRNQLVRLIRDNIVVYEGKFNSLKRFKDDVKEVADGYECGIVLERFNDVKAGDIIECYKEEKIAATL